MHDPLVWKQRIRTIRAFNYSAIMQAGVLRERLLHSSYSLTESRIIFEISQHAGCTATDLSRNLGLDPGYLSRLLGRLEQSGVIERPRSESDGRRRVLRLTAQGHKVAELLNRRVDDDVAEYLAGISEEDQLQLMEAIETIGRIDKSRESRAAQLRYFLRDMEGADVPLLLRAYETVFEQTFGGVSGFGEVLAETVGRLFETGPSPAARCWIAEMNGEAVGSLVLEALERDEKSVHIKLFMVEPRSRGLGIGGSLLDEGIRWALGQGYDKLLLWMVPDQARIHRLFGKKGFALTERPTIPYMGTSFDLECWELNLRGDASTEELAQSERTSKSTSEK
ncbi:bifunctional helix-turn-helix transcriptional regulator/GNAT family N-acetyltransferase [Saccharibacillus sp. CPCC 101409]|uniref:bifunctional helix-turn-helix transcriptional regulator/GNAT family N-acetyltransferase n=1 Tax=Saccharibacillus sp. CPCC 101409 TaxID=3058041 RepID=UPI0026716257|nr:bifunctional helix-turn-helix transcriptional regulator/GNAT family N-acetyltransferase [Saccharibacillus sp. CPCC 101409]MDO3410218.1 bifunctional helix-turn-helix transcriptional regulator/GNAT family N-acetyltransferase [Saccharibacillus sp. CPCC 101409]